MTWYPTPLLVFALALAQVAAITCGPEGGSFSIAGSSTVFPIAEAWATAYLNACPSIDITVEGGGSSDGAGRVCANEDRGSPVDIGDMSREWKVGDEVAVSDEADYIYECLKGDTSRSVIQIDVAIDGLSVATQSGGFATECIREMGGLTTDQLRWIFSSYNESQLEATGWDPTSLANSDGNSSTHLWSELSADCDPVEIKIAGADDLSGTYDYFMEAVLIDYENGETFDHNRPDGYFNSVEDEDIVLYLEANSGDCIGFFGFAYYYQNRQILVAAHIQNSAGEFVEPTHVTVGDDSYNPLSRRIYMNLLNDDETLAHTAPFLRFGLSTEGDKAIASTGYVEIPDVDVILSRLPPAPEGESETSEPSGAQLVALGGAKTVSVISTLLLLLA